jgi:hypothetical protein
MKVSVVPSREVEGGTGRQSYSTDLLPDESMRYDVQGSISTLGAGSVQCRPLLLVEQLGRGQRLRSGDELGTALALGIGYGWQADQSDESLRNRQAERGEGSAG